MRDNALDRHNYIAKHVCSFILSGKQIIRSEYDEQITLNAGTLCLFPKGIYTVSDLIPQNGHFEAILFFFDQSIIDRFLSMQSLRKPRMTQANSFLKLSNSEPLATYLRSIAEIPHSVNQPSAALFHLKLIELLCLLDELHPAISIVDRLVQMNQRKPSNLRSFLERNYDKPLTVEDYAYLTGRSISTFRRAFKQQFQTTPQKWLIQKRMQKAKSLLQQGQDSVTQVAYEVGYDNVSHFIAAFKKEYQLTPKQAMLNT